MPTAAPDPSEWPKAYARIQQITDREILRMLQLATADIRRQMTEIARRPQGGIGSRVRHEQLMLVQRNMIREQAAIFRKLGDTVRARRLDAAARAIQLGGAIDSALLERAGATGQARALVTAALQGLEHTVEVALARMGQSAVPLAQRIYRTEVWMRGRVQDMINSALSRGLSAREFGREAVDWFSPNTPGGVRYASMRLARTEINNAFHAVSINHSMDKPWVEHMKWHLSGSHPKPDVCDAYAKGGDGTGLYVPRDVPRKPHPHCLCYVTPQTVGEGAFLDALVGGKYDSYLNSKLGKVTR